MNNYLINEKFDETLTKEVKDILYSIRRRGYCVCVSKGGKVFTAIESPPKNNISNSLHDKMLELQSLGFDLFWRECHESSCHQQR